MNKSYKVQILLSTYNGEKYIKEQLDSIINIDNYQDIKVLIRDDGSTDETINILKQYANKYGFEVHFGKNIGINKSMQWLFLNCSDDVDFYALCDQDDVWLKDKFTILFGKLDDMYNDDIPCLLASCSSITNENLKITGKSQEPIYGVSFYNAMIQNVCPGHTQIINKKMLNLLIIATSSKISVIDHWIYLLASAFGNIYFSIEPTVLHRQHSKNTVGYQTKFIKKTIQRLKRLKLKQTDTITEQLKSFYDIYSFNLNEKYKKEVENFLNSQNIKLRLYYIFHCSVYRQTKFETFIFKILFLIKKYHI